jgi:hypothetical protein
LDPVSLLFSAYLNSVQNLALTPPEDTDPVGKSSAALIINYKGNSVPFEYQSWTIKNDSVCDEYSLRSTKYSNCTTRATMIFNKLCTQLKRTANDDPDFIQTKIMYCNAAVFYEPSQAVVISDLHKSQLKKAKKICTAAIAFVMASREGSQIGNRNRVCSNYLALKKSIFDT